MNGEAIKMAPEVAGLLDDMRPEEQPRFVPNRADYRRWGRKPGNYRQPSKLHRAAWHPLRVLNLARGKASIAQRSAWVKLQREESK